MNISSTKLLYKAGSELIWFWVAIEPKDREFLSTGVSKERKICLL